MDRNHFTHFSHSVRFSETHFSAKMCNRCCLFFFSLLVLTAYTTVTERIAVEPVIFEHLQLSHMVGLLVVQTVKLRSEQNRAKLLAWLKIHDSLSGQDNVEVLVTNKKQ